MAKNWGAKDFRLGDYLRSMFGSYLGTSRKDREAAKLLNNATATLNKINLDENSLSSQVDELFSKLNDIGFDVPPALKKATIERANEAYQAWKNKQKELTQFREGTKQDKVDLDLARNIAMNIGTSNKQLDIVNTDVYNKYNKYMGNTLDEPKKLTDGKVASTVNFDPANKFVGIDKIDLAVNNKGDKN